MGIRVKSSLAVALIAAGTVACAPAADSGKSPAGDVAVVLKPNYIPTEDLVGTTHGSPHPYDTHVPLLWYGVGVKPGIYAQRVGIDDLAPTLAHLLGIPAPPMSRGRILF